MTTTTEPSVDTNAAARRWLKPLGYALDWRIERLQAEYLRGAPAARADLARLRRGLGKQAGSVPEIWEITVGAVPAELIWDRDEPSRAEQAAHAAMTLFALHQQSLAGPAHVPGVSFGSAVGRLASGDGPSKDAVTRRFMTVATAESADELLVHVRGLVTQLKGARRGIDYAQFADHVLDLLTPGLETAVRLAWGRDFYRVSAESDNDTQNREGNTQ